MPLSLPHAFENRSIRQILYHRAQQEGDALAYEYLEDGCANVSSSSYFDLHRKASDIGAWLSGAGAAGKPVVLIYPPGLDFIAAFFGALYARAIPVPLPSPGRAEAGRRIRRVVADTSTPIVLTASSLVDQVGILVPLGSGHGPIQVIATNTPAFALAATDARPCAGDEAADGERIAFLQYTSGSTATPKGVVVTNSNLSHNLQLMVSAMGLDRSSRGVSWLPQYHDMGLIGGILLPLFAGFPVTLMSPASFVRAPIRWLRQISDLRATISGAPDFGYAHCARTIPPDLVAGLDLSAWRVAVSGAEAIRANTIASFVETFASAGFRRTSFFPCYGLAEATLLVTGGPAGEDPLTERFTRSSLEIGAAVQRSEGLTDSRDVVSSGRVLASTEVAIVDPVTRCLLDGSRVGEIWVAGPSVGAGYWQNSDATAEAFGASPAGQEGGGFLRTGDIGFTSDGNLFVLGRSSEMLNVRGRNFFPADLEAIAEATSQHLRPGSGAAFAVEAEGHESVVLVYETGLGENDALGTEAGVAEAVLRESGLALDEICLVRRNSVPRTTSGKVQRGVCRSQYLDQKLRVIRRWARRTDAAATFLGFATDLPTILALPTERRPAALEAALATGLAQHLAVDRSLLSPDASFFSMGVDSVAAAVLASRVSKALLVEVTIAEVFESPTLALLSGLLAEKLRTAYGEEKQVGRLAALTARLKALPPEEAASLLMAARSRSGVAKNP